MAQVWTFVIAECRAVIVAVYTTQVRALVGAKHGTLIATGLRALGGAKQRALAAAGLWTVGAAELGTFADAERRAFTAARLRALTNTGFGALAATERWTFTAAKLWTFAAAKLRTFSAAEFGTFANAEIGAFAGAEFGAFDVANALIGTVGTADPGQDPSVGFCGSQLDTTFQFFDVQVLKVQACDFVDLMFVHDRFFPFLLVTRRYRFEAFAFTAVYPIISPLSFLSIPNPLPALHSTVFLRLGSRLDTRHKIQIGLCCAGTEAGCKTIAVVGEKLVISAHCPSDAAAATIKCIATPATNRVRRHGATSPGLLRFSVEHQIAVLTDVADAFLRVARPLPADIDIAKWIKEIHAHVGRAITCFEARQWIGLLVENRPDATF
jgi:hypothetical protein